MKVGMYVGVEPKIGVENPPNHPFVHRGIPLLFTIHFGVPLFLETPMYVC